MASEDSAAKPQPFLLIVCTRHIVTVPSDPDGTSSAGYSEFPAYSQVLLRLALLNLRTVIVTAAVYRGLVSVLRVTPNTST